ncbi:hypothetical protein [Streptomyces anulatus]|uniref:hypothetical protein n=1 Tax=Streptomyces anulatus TaxID=1892 RepID=UPI00343150EC
MPVTALDAATDVLDRARQLLALDAAPTPIATREDIRRAALALGVAAVDTYMHWAIRKVAFADPLPKELAKLEVPFGAMLDIANASVEARKQGIAHRPQVKARNVMNEKLLTMTFQSPAGIERGLQMLGISKCWGKLSAVIQPQVSTTELKVRLGQIAHRRNKIVHEGDLARQERPREVKREAISAQEVHDDLDWIESFIKALASL